MRSRLLVRVLVVVAPLVLLAGCRCCPESAAAAGLPTRVDMDASAPAR